MLRYYWKSCSLAVLTFLISFACPAQEHKVNRTLDQMRAALTTGQPAGDNEELLFKPGNEMLVLTRMGEWGQDSVETVRREAVGICARLGLKTGEAPFRQQAVRMIVMACRDADVALQETALNYLTHFTRSDFTKDACDTIRGLLQIPSQHRDKVVRLAGFLDLSDQKSVLEGLLQQPSTKLQWSAHLALARMGSETSTAVILGLVKNYPVDDEVMYHVLPDLVYTRQKAISDYLLEILHSDVRNCTSPNPYFSGNIVCGYRVMEALAGVVRDFPLKINKSGEIVTDDYERALRMSRKWFDEHPDFELNRSIY